ncbi:membrane protein [Ktedonobacter sp. SOSP1-52]|uniref:DUF2231 domain-containing protein n=1 Tax=Ktedonobacter sp. SOSP1-52 TaxID=2778366 RepID=UPI001915219F|nr:DUF2231 domain-containing protein [Ktedonobacter sp. SOSP1-52]GHO70451.1 membrane protein [Ktedonobacter sp. SOSP1-52]
MESKVKLFGHPIHPMLIAFPLGLLATSLVFDIVHWITGNGFFSHVAFWMIAAGVIGGLLAAIFGLIDWLIIPSGTRAKTVGMFHGVGNVVIVVLFIVSWLLRMNTQTNPSVLAYALSVVGVVLALITSWLGGELVDRLGVGVDEGAHLDTPSSLRGQKIPVRASLNEES